VQGVDGNFLRMQGEALSRLQVGLQAETQAQQVRAQSATEEDLRRLREEVAATETSKGEDRGPSAVAERGADSSGNRASPGGTRADGKTARPAVEEGEIIPPPPFLGSRIDTRA
jgi:hypothetical protein